MNTGLRNKGWSCVPGLRPERPPRSGMTTEFSRSPTEQSATESLPRCCLASRAQSGPWSPYAARGDLVEPVVELLRPLPPIAVILVSMIFLGIGDAAKIAVVAYGASFPILINAIDAVRSLHPMLSHVARSLRLTRAERMRLVDLPAALPRIAAGIRLSITVSLLLAIVSEMLLSTNGLGAFLVRSQESFRIDDVLAALLLIVLVALLVNLTTEAVERKLLAWHHASAGAR
jgi:NitT/TauT family transport system permease protein